MALAFFLLLTGILLGFLGMVWLPFFISGSSSRAFVLQVAFFLRVSSAHHVHISLFLFLILT
jgi:hypothetical protein